MGENKKMVTVKKNGQIYKMTKDDLKKIVAVVFEGESPLCQICKNSWKCPKLIGEDYIVDGVSLENDNNANYVLDCSKYGKEVYVYGYHGDFPDEQSEPSINQEEATIKKYGDAHRASVAHPLVKRAINRI